MLNFDSRALLKRDREMGSRKSMVVKGDVNGAGDLIRGRKCYLLFVRYCQIFKKASKKLALGRGWDTL